MKDFLSLAKARYSVRKYKDTPIPEKAFARVLQAGQVAPTACNAQAVHVYVLKSEAALAKARSLTKFTFDAPAVLLVCYDSERTWQNKLEPGVTSGQQDAAIVATHMMLQAWEEGLGTCWVNLFPNSQAKEMLGLATNHVPFKNRKLISMLLTVSMLLTLFPFAAFAGETEVGQEQAAPVEAQKVAEINGTQYGTLSDAINAVQDGETIKLLDAVSETNVVSVDNGKTFTIDLNGKTLSLGARMSIKYAFVTVQNGTIKGDIALTASGKDAAYNSFTLASNAAIEGNYGIMVFEDKTGANNFGTTVNIDGKITGQSSALWVIGNITTDYTTAKHPVTVNVGPTAVLTNPSKDATALQMAGSCVVTIEDGAQITGGTAIEVRAGKLTVNGGTITGTGDSTTSDPNRNGISTKGAGIAVAQHTTKQPIDVVVNGGTITGHTGFYVANPQKNAEVSEVNATINGGDFVTTAPDGNAVVRDENAGGADVAVTGGSFTGKVDQSLLGEGFEAVPDANGKLTVAVSANAEATWYQNGVKKAGTLMRQLKHCKVKAVPSKY